MNAPVLSGVMLENRLQQQPATGASNRAISVAMATYNGQQFIQRQLESLARQTRLPAELVITDDASKDKTRSIVEEFAKAAPFPVSFYQNDARLGYRKNFMRAASLCRSGLIAFCDQDDFWYPHKLAKCADPFGDPEVLLVYHDANVVTDDGKQIDRLTVHLPRQRDGAPTTSNPWPYSLGFTQVFRRSLLALSEQWPKSRDQHEITQPLAHDQWFFFLASVFGRIAHEKEPLADYVQHGSNTYGWEPKGFSNRLALFRRYASTQYFCLAKDAECRAIVLDAARKNLEGSWLERAADAAEYFRVVSTLNEDRNTLYTSPSFFQRFKAFCTILKKNGYWGPWGLGPKSFVVDACIGVPIGPTIAAESPN